ncbi:MAG: DUF4928 family protein [Anaerolineae bacterium]|nr:DUF4928 family protein [Anaerolineae bacterium]
MAEQTNPIDSLRNAIVRWLQQEGTARSTLAGAIVVLDRLRDYAPLSNKDIFTSGGQLVGGRGEALRNTLARNGETRVFLADGVTTRSTEKFRRLAEAIDCGKALAPFPDARRESAVIQLVEPVLHEISNWFERQHMTITCDRGESLSHGSSKYLKAHILSQVAALNSIWLALNSSFVSQDSE